MNSALYNKKLSKFLFSINSQCILAECALWHEAQQAIYWVDIIGAKIQRCHYKTHAVEIFDMPYRIGCFAFTPEEDEIIAAFDIGIARYNLKTEHIAWLAQPEIHLINNRFNDGRADRQGRFWAGTMNEANDQDLNLARKGKLYCVDGTDTEGVISCEAKISDISISNGLCWSKDGSILYHADSPKRIIHAYDFDVKTAELSNKRVFATTKGHRFPDGSIVDAQDHIWNAQWGASQVVRYKPNGELDIVIDLPVSQPSSVAIGGPNMDLLIVTTARHSLSAERLPLEPQAGNIFVYQLYDIRGIAEPICLV
ncbi:MAG: L-arabinonolactonase [Glaciecola sp.]